MILERGNLFADKYEIVGVLSAGVQASVYTALQKPLDRTVILKILSPALVANQEIVSRFEREAKLLSTLKDDNITKIYDFGKHNGVYFFVSEYIEGQSVKELLERKGRLSSELASYIVLETAKTLTRLHKQGIVHRDLKPGNILLSYDGKVKLTDFGLAFSQALPSLTIEGSILGTPAYMPPEQILGKAVDFRSDIYSLGVVFYELLTGTNPFVANNYSAIMHNVLNLKPTTVYKTDKSLEETKDLWQIIERMMKKQPAERQENISEVCEKLDAWFGKEENKDWRLDTDELSTEIRQPTIKTVKTTKKSRTYFIAASSTVILLAVVIVLIIRNRPTKLILNKSNSEITTSETDFIQSSPHRAVVKKESLSSISAQLPNVNSKPLNKTLSTAKTSDTLSSVSPFVPPLKGSGFVKIQALPWATVYIDGNEIFTTPKDTTLELSAGQHRLKLINPNFPAFESVFSVTEKQALKLIIDLRDKISYLEIAVTPWADIYIDDEFKATTPLSQPLIINSGKHKITVKNPYYAPYQETIEFNPRETVERNIVLK